MTGKTPQLPLKSLVWPMRLTLAGLWAERLARAFWPLWSVSYTHLDVYKRQIRDRYIHVLIDCFLGNGYGVSGAAEVSYEKMLARFSSPDAGAALRLFIDPVYSSLLASSVGRAQWARLLDILEPKLTSTTDRTLMAAIRAFTGNPDQLRLDTNIKSLANAKA